MSSIISDLGQVAGNTVGETIAFAAGTAGHRALTPISEAFAQRAWETAPIALTPAEFLAEGVAHGKVDADSAAAWAKKQGFGTEQWQAMVAIAEVGPALGYAYQLWRRGFITDAEFDTALQRSGLEQQWGDAMRNLKGELLDLGALATAIHRGIIAGDDLLLREPPTDPGDIPQVPPSSIDAITEAAGHGVDKERLRVLVGNTGLPLSLGEMLQLLNRGQVQEDDVRRAVAQSNLRNEYMDVALALRRRLLTPHEYAELNLRGWINTDAMHAGAALSGMEPADADLLFKSLGRPLNVHAVTTGLARGGKYGGDYEGVPEPYATALRQSSVRPEWGNIAYANRFTIPSYFVLKTLAADGAITRDELEQLFLNLGWPPNLAKGAADAYAGGSTGKADAHVTKAQTQLWDALHRSYIRDLATDAVAEQTLGTLGVAEAARTQVLELWQAERSLIRSSLTAAQIVKAVTGKVVDPATGQPFTEQWGQERLQQLGYSSEDAQILLVE